MDEYTTTFTFSTSDNDADFKARTAVFSNKGLKFVYHNLNPEYSYALALTYATDQVFKRIQSLWADGIELHKPIALPKGKAIKVYVSIPKSVTQDGNMTLEIKIHGEVNATVSTMELWSSGPASPDMLKINSVSAIYTGLQGRTIDIMNEPVIGTRIGLIDDQNGKEIGTAVSGSDGWFYFKDITETNNLAEGHYKLIAEHNENKSEYKLIRNELVFDPIKYHPIPVKTNNLAKNKLSLDGIWKIHPKPLAVNTISIMNKDIWHDVKIPGQWKQQGFEIPQDQTTAVYKSFTIPASWKGNRIFLRFEAIHSGTNYWINEQKLGYSENLFTPVEWEITKFVKYGAANKLYFEMKVQTISEQLSWSSSYAFHSLGGIDRSVWIYALPKICVKDMRINTDLDNEYRNGRMNIDLTIDNPTANDINATVANFRLLDDKKILVSEKQTTIKTLNPGINKIQISIDIEDPKKWNAEKPYLYKALIDLKLNDELLESIEQNVGFRKIEVKNSEVLINGQVVKFAGICHHEIDPLTGRADTARRAETDVKMLKEANLNYIRTSHYPPTKELVDAADKVGMYIEVEAPFCSVASNNNMTNLHEVLTPTSAMVDYYGSNPSVIVWSIANESNPNPEFVISNRMIKSIDPTRLTTFNHPMSKPEMTYDCDINNYHYTPMPFDNTPAKDDLRPYYMGEYFFPVCHEQTDVKINPGLRELWGHGHADPETEWGKYCAESYKSPYLKPGLPAGAWSYINNSKRTTGGSIWAANDDSFYFPDGTHAGFSWHHGYWGLIDAWRRPKPEYWFSRLIFSPVWFPKRNIDFNQGDEKFSLPVENRYSFTDLSELKFTQIINGKRTRLKVSLKPRSTGTILLRIPSNTPIGSIVRIEVIDQKGRFINTADIILGKKINSLLPKPSNIKPEWKDENNQITVKGDRYTFVINKSAGELDISDPEYNAPITKYPSIHMTQYDFGDLAGDHEPYAIYPNTQTRTIKDITVIEQKDGIEIKITDKYKDLTGSISWLIDRSGLGIISYDYEYTGDILDTREQGIRIKLPKSYDEIRWNRWSEWGNAFPEESISRTIGSAKAFRNKTELPDNENITPNRQWKYDQTEMGTADFRSIKFCVYDASLVNETGGGIKVYADADAHIRSNATEDGIVLHILNSCRMGETIIKNGDKLSGKFTIQLLSNKTQ